MQRKTYAIAWFFTRWELTACFKLIRLMSYCRWKILCKVTTNIDCSVQPEQVTYSHLPWILYIYSLRTCLSRTWNVIAREVGVRPFSYTNHFSSTAKHGYILLNKILGVAHMHRDQLQQSRSQAALQSS